MAGRRELFEDLYGECHGPVFGYVLRRTENPDDAADVIAETFLIAWRRLDEIPLREQRRLWLYGVARRVLANHRRGQRRRSSLADRLRADLALTPRPPEHTGECQWPSSSPHWRPRISPLVAIFSPRWWPRISPPTD
jgi:RNA polymerase sigma-70 factor (ECF subfamily)